MLTQVCIPTSVVRAVSGSQIWLLLKLIAKVTNTRYHFSIVLTELDHSMKPCVACDWIPNRTPILTLLACPEAHKKTQRHSQDKWFVNLKHGWMKIPTGWLIKILVRSGWSWALAVLLHSSFANFLHQYIKEVWGLFRSSSWNSSFHWFKQSDFLFFGILTYNRIKTKKQRQKKLLAGIFVKKTKFFRLH